MFTPEEIDVCKEFIARARDIIQQELVFEMRSRYTMERGSKEDMEQRKLHETHQILAWQEVKELAVNHRDTIIAHRNNSDDDTKELIDQIMKVIDDEINEILLKD